MESKDQDIASYKSYITGLFLSLLLTITAFTIVAIHVYSGHTIFAHSFIIPIILFLALVQFIVQVIFFLHLGREAKPRFNSMLLIFMVILVFILAGGSLWIMHSLSYRMILPGQQNKYVIDQMENGL